MLWPFQVFAIRTHVVFTEDGKTLIDSDARQHSARRSQCRSWWNDTWRDRLLASTAALRDVQTGKIMLRLSASENAALETAPLYFTAPLSYAPVESVPIEDTLDLDDIEEEADEQEVAIL